MGDPEKGNRSEGSVMAEKDEMNLIKFIHSIAKDGVINIKINSRRKSSDKSD